MKKQYKSFIITNKMSSKQRRVNGAQTSQQQPQPIPSQQGQNSSRPVDMTLPQVLQMLDSRLRKLESQPIKDESAEGVFAQLETRLMKLETTSNEVSDVDSPISEIISSWKEFQSEYDSRFNILATEINQLKDVVMKLQSFTMEVNKSLYENHVHFSGKAPEIVAAED